MVVDNLTCPKRPIHIHPHSKMAAAAADAAEAADLAECRELQEQEVRVVQ